MAVLVWHESQSVGELGRVPELRGSIEAHPRDRKARPPTDVALDSRHWFEQRLGPMSADGFCPDEKAFHLGGLVSATEFLRPKGVWRQAREGVRRQRWRCGKPWLRR